MLFFILHVVLSWPALTPNLKDIGTFDEAGYIEIGRGVAAGLLPAVNYSPVTGLFFALTYLPVQNSDFG